jgi:hypothetical protein
MDPQFAGRITIGQTLDRGTRLFARALKKTILFFLIPALIMLWPMTRIAGSLPQVVRGNTGLPFDVSILLCFPMIFIEAWIVLITARYMFQLSLGKDLSLTQMVRLAGIKDVVRIIITLFIMVAISLIGLMLALVPPIWYMAVYYSAKDSPGTVIAFLPMAAISCISVLLLVLFTWFTNNCIIGILVAAVEDGRYFAWYKRMCILCKKHWWKTAAINSIVLLIIIIPMAAIASIPGFAGAAHDLPSTGQAASLPSMIGILISQIAEAVLLPLCMAICLVYYQYLRAEKENC